MLDPFFSSPAAELEVEFALLAAQICDNGIPLNVPAAQALLAELEERSGALAGELQVIFPPKIIEEVRISKVNHKKPGRVKDQPYIKRTVISFNPNSSPQIAERLMALGWVPVVLTEGGAPSTKAAVLAPLEYPEARVLLALKVATKIISMLCAEKGWLNTVSPDGRIHTSYRTLGTVTGRCSHQPNIPQVPRIKRDKDTKQPLLGQAGHWGHECRSLFTVPPEWPNGQLVGIDMSGLELRCLAHYLSPWDQGEYATIACDKPHDSNAALIGNVTRDQAKTFIYACVYGAGDYKLGMIVELEQDDDYSVRWIGAQARAALIEGITGFHDLFAWLDQPRNHGDQYIEGLDGRPLFVRKPHAKLNTLLQAAGSVLCKQWAVLTDDALQAKGLHHGDDYQIVAHVHDEMVIATRTPEIAETVAEIGVAMCAEAGRHYDLQCPLDGESHIGFTWADIH